MSSSEHPVYPITVRDLETGETDSFNSEIELITGLEFFDSKDPEEKVEVSDSMGRRVILKIWRLKIVDFKLA